MAAIVLCGGGPSIKVNRLFQVPILGFNYYETEFCNRMFALRLFTHTPECSISRFSIKAPTRYCFVVIVQKISIRILYLIVCVARNIPIKDHVGFPMVSYGSVLKAEMICYNHKIVLV